MYNKLPLVFKIILPIITAPLAALVIWMLIATQFKQDDTLQLQLQADKANFGKVVWQQSKAEPEGIVLAYKEGIPLTKSTYPVTITIDPISSKNPAAQGQQVWIYNIRTDKTESPNWKTYQPIPAPWEPIFDSGISGQEALMFPGGQPQPFTYHTVTSNGNIVLMVLSHAWSGGVRITVNGASQIFDLYGPGVLKFIQLKAPRYIGDTTTLKVPGIPVDQTTLRWNLADQPSLIKLTSAQLEGSRQWRWSAGMELPRIGLGVQVITNTTTELLLSIEDPSNAWIEFNNLPAASNTLNNRHDLLIVLGMTGCIWFGMLLIYFWNNLAAQRKPWATASMGIIPISFLAIIIIVPTILNNSAGADKTTHFVATAVVEKLDTPTGMAFSADGRMLIIEKGGFGGVASGKVKLLRPGGQTPEVVLELPVCSNVERGLLGIALDPNFTTNGYLYLYYTRQLDNCSVGPATPNTPRNRVSRFTMVNDKIAPASEVVLVDDIPSVVGAHNAGNLRFGPDEKLYISTGEGELGNNAQNLSSLGGKILRIVPDPAKLVPSDNPFVTDPDPHKQLIWAYGLRNSFRFGIHPGNGMILAGDVGSEPPKAREELNSIVRGGNYGWPLVEGIPYEPKPEYISPIYAYDHDNACNTIIGGVFITGDAYPATYRDNFVFGDFSCGTIWRAEVNSSGKLGAVTEILHANGQHPVDFTQDHNGTIFYSDMVGKIWRLDYQANNN